MGSGGGDNIIENVGGTVLHWADEGFGELSGRNARRAREADARKIAQEAAARKKVRDQQLMDMMNADINASNAAARNLPRTPRTPNSVTEQAAQELKNMRDLLGR